ncbi:MAG: cupin-like domain-containing protein [Flavobacteriales bacterium]|nr:cupin-like domain-containing protein [Flavobacteriales bacterium]
MSNQMHSDFRRIPYKWRLRYGYYQFFDHFLTRPFFSKITKKGRRRFFRRLENWLKEGGTGKVIPVERKQNLTYTEFMENYVKKGVPVILTGQAAEWACTKTWSLDYFQELHGKDKVLFADKPNVEEDVYHETTLEQVIDRIKNGDSEYYRFYPLLKRHPEHLLDFDYKWIRKRRIKRGFGEAFQVFISGKNGYTTLHNAGTPNIFTQVTGEKKWMLYPVEYTCIVDPDPARNVYRSAPMRNQTVFNPFENSLEYHQLYQYMDGYSVHLKAGDVFYNPPYMWHCVQNPTESIGVGYRYFAPWTAFKAAPLYMLLELFSFRPPIWKTWKNYDDINIIHLAETGQLKRIAKEKGTKKITSTVT